MPTTKSVRRRLPRAFATLAVLTAVLAGIAGSMGTARAQEITQPWEGCFLQSDATGTVWTDLQCPVLNGNGWWEDSYFQNGQWVHYYYVFHYGDGGYQVVAANGNQILVHPDGTVEYYDFNGVPTTQDWINRMDNGGGQTDVGTWLQDTSGWSTANINSIFGGYLNLQWLAITCTTAGYTCYP
jgi:hypothetical protein